MEFRRIVPEDADFVSGLRNSVAEEFLHDSHKFTAEQTRKWIEETSPEFWMIEMDGIPVGYFRVSNWNRTNRNLYVGADIREDMRGKGMGFSSYRLFIPFAFREYGIHKMTLEVLATNHRAIALYRKLGFVYEGAKRQEVLKKDGYVDSILMSLTEDEMKNYPDIYS